jgi:hypothetical protein
MTQEYIGCKIAHAFRKAVLLGESIKTRSNKKFALSEGRPRKTIPLIFCYNCNVAAINVMMRLVAVNTVI